MATQSSPEVRGSTGEAGAAAPFHRLLVPVDFTSAARAAVALALRIAERWGSEVILFHAAGQDDNDEFMDYTGVPWGRGDVVADVSQHLMRFADAVEPGASNLVRVDATKADDPVGAVVGACTRHAPSLLVVGAHPHARQRLFRTRAERIVRRVACPVLVVRGEAEVPVDADT
jgi:nucleotide-binding universal stress UspA family protein